MFEMNNGDGDYDDDDEAMLITVATVFRNDFEKRVDLYDDFLMSNSLNDSLMPAHDRLHDASMIHDPLSA